MADDDNSDVEFIGTFVKNEENLMIKQHQHHQVSITCVSPETTSRHVRLVKPFFTPIEPKTVPLKKSLNYLVKSEHSRCQQLCLSATHASTTLTTSNKHIRIVKPISERIDRRLCAKTVQFKAKQTSNLSHGSIIKSNIRRHFSFNVNNAHILAQSFVFPPPEPLYFELANLRHSITSFLRFESYKVFILPQVDFAYERICTIADKLAKWATVCKPDCVKTIQNIRSLQLLSTHFSCLHSLLVVLIEEHKLNANSSLTGNSQNCVHSLYSMGVINFWNAIESYNKLMPYGNGTLRSLCPTVQCPDWILDCRNALSHCNRNPPSSELLNGAVAFALDWMDKHFWPNLRLRPLGDDLNGVLLCYELPFNGFDQYTIRERILFPNGADDYRQLISTELPRHCGLLPTPNVIANESSTVPLQSHILPRTL